MDTPKSSAELAAEGLHLWSDGHLEEARKKFEEALLVNSPGYPQASDLHSQLAGVLSTLGNFDEAGVHYRKALEYELRLSYNLASNAITVARYFLGTHLLAVAKPLEALDSIRDYCEVNSTAKWLLRLVESEALYDLGKLDEVEKAANRTLDAAPTEEKRTELQGWFVEHKILQSV